MSNTPQSSGAQYRPVVPAQQGQPFTIAPQQFRPVGMPSSNVGIPTGQSQPLPYSQPMQQLPPWPSQPGHSAPSSQAVPMPYAQQNRPLMSGSSQSQQAAPALSHYAPGSVGSGVPLSSPYSFVPSSFGQPQSNANTMSQFQPISQMHAPVVPVSGQPWMSSGAQSASIVAPVETHGQQPSASSSLDPSSNDWQEHTAPDGRRYYYNRRTKQSSWEKPLELMTPIERADASTVWKEFTTPEGKKYYYNKITKQSKWSMPEELKLAREQAEQAGSQGTQLGKDAVSLASATVAVSSAETSNNTISVSSVSASTLSVVTSSPVPVTPVVSGSSSVPAAQSSIASDIGGQPPIATMNSLPATVGGSSGVSAAIANVGTVSLNSFDNLASQGTANSADGASTVDIEESKKGMMATGKGSPVPLEEKAQDDEPLVFANKQDAKNAFKSLLESANVQSDWTWEQAMREIHNDKRYGALKTLGERKQTFYEYLAHRKKIEGEERRLRQKKAREEFTKMLEESKELTSFMKWSKAASLFETDERFKAVEKPRDREDLFNHYVVELEKKEKAKAAEEHKRNLAQFRTFLESCDFIKVNSQWRKVQDRLEDDERCLRLEKLDRLLVFQDYIYDLEKEEEEQKKIQKEQLRRAERKNRDAFRKLMEEHVATGILTAKTHWLDYCLKVKDSSEYQGVANNLHGSKPKDLFEDVYEELDRQYHEDKTRIKDVMKLEKITMVSTWSFEDFKAAIADNVGSPPVSDVNFKLLYEELLERAKEKEEKEAKKRQRLADDFTKLLSNYKEMTASSTWDDCRPLVEESHESMGEEMFSREIFEGYVARLQDKAKEKERKREEEKAKKEKEREEKDKRKERDKREKEKDREREKVKERTRKDDTDSENVDATDSYSHKDEKKKEKDRDRKHRKRHQSVTDDISSDKDEKEESKKSRRHSSDRKKSRKHAHTPESDSESRHKKHKRDHRDSSHRNGGYEELEDGEVGEDGEIQ